MSARRRRTRRARGTGATFLTPRDFDVLTFVGLNAYVSTEQVARELFPSPDRARRRLRQLFDAGYVDVVLASSTLPNLVRLTRDGIAALRERLPEVAERIRPPGPLALAGIAHHVALVDMRAYASALAEREGGQLGLWSNAGGPLHQALRLREEFRLVPDALCEFMHMVIHDPAVGAPNGGILRVAVEVDRNTEPSEVLQEKAEKYADAFDANGTGETPLHELWLLDAADSTGRVEQLRRALLRAGIGERARVFKLAGVRQRPAAPLPPTLAGVGERRGRASRAERPRKDSAS